MDPTAAADPEPESAKDGDWHFPDDIEFPVLTKVLVNFYKVAEVISDGSKLLNTKIIKVEISLEKKDLLRKQNLLEAIQREADLKELAKEEAVSNPKYELSVQRKETNEVYRVTKMKHVVNRLSYFQKKQDQILIEVKEQILTFQAKSPTIKIMINNEHERSPGLVRGRVLCPKTVVSLAPSLKNLSGSEYEKETGRIICGLCKIKVKPRPKGAATSILRYFKSTHFDVCGNRERKRKAKEDLKGEENKKKEQAAVNQKYWERLSKKDSFQSQPDDDDSSDNEVLDPDLG